MDQAYALMHEKKILNRFDVYQNTPLYYALMSEDLYMIEMLLKLGAKQTPMNASNHPALFYAIMFNNPALIELLIKYDGLSTINTPTKKLLAHAPKAIQAYCQTSQE